MKKSGTKKNLMMMIGKCEGEIKIMRDSHVKTLSQYKQKLKGYKTKLEELEYLYHN